MQSVTGLVSEGIQPGRAVAAAAKAMRRLARWRGARAALAALLMWGPLAGMAAPGSDGPAAGQLFSYTLQAADVAPLAPQPAAEAAAWQALVGPLAQVRYPSQALLEAALRAPRCVQLDPALLAQLPASWQLPTDDRRCRSAGQVVLQVPASWLTAQRVQHIADRARRVHTPEDASPTRWGAQTDCACGPRDKGELVMGFWPEALPVDAPRSVNLGLFDRITVPGPQATAAGDITTPANWARHAHALARAALGQRTRLDLMLHIGGTPAWLALPQADRTRLAQGMAQQAMGLVNLPLDNALMARLPFGHRHAFDGITLVLGEWPQGDAQAGGAALGAWVRSLMQALIGPMQQAGRPLALNLVVPYHLMGATAAYSHRDLTSYLGLAGDAGQGPRSSPVQVHFLVPLPEPTSTSKKALQARLDADYQLAGGRRVALQGAIVPVLLHTTGPALAPTPDSPGPQLQDDLAYAKWQFGGVGLWPMPVQGVGTGAQVIEKLTQEFRAPTGRGRP